MVRLGSFCHISSDPPVAILDAPMWLVPAPRKQQSPPTRNGVRDLAPFARKVALRGVDGPRDAADPAVSGSWGPPPAERREGRVTCPGPIRPSAASLCRGAEIRRSRPGLSRLRFDP